MTIHEELMALHAVVQAARDVVNRTSHMTDHVPPEGETSTLHGHNVISREPKGFTAARARLRDALAKLDALDE